MKHGLLIIWHNNFKQLQELLNCFDDSFHVYIHIDRKVQLFNNEKEWLKLHPLIKGVYNKYAIRWGHFALLKAELFLLEKAVADDEITYLHIISGQDFPIKSKSLFMDFFEKNNGREYVNYVNLPYSKWDNGTYERYQFYRPNLYFLPISWENKLVSMIINIQKKIKFKRRIPDQYDYLYGGSNWFSITRECAKYVVGQKGKSFYNKLKFTFAPEETFFATVIMNSPFASHVVNDNLRYINWGKDNTGHPCILKQSDWAGIIMSNAFFARKFESKKSYILKQNIKKYILVNEEIKINSQNGAWQTISISGHCFDKRLAKAILDFVPLLGVSDIADFGCGPGWYTYLLYQQGFNINGYDGNPNVKEITSLLFGDGFYCQYADFSMPITVKDPFDLIICLEVGEHIPSKYEDIFMRNITENSKKYVLLSWAVPEQAGWGHVNCHSNEYVIRRMKQFGFKYNHCISQMLRKSASLYWFKETILFFEK